MKSGNLGEECGRAEAADAAADDNGVQVFARELLRRESLRNCDAFIVISYKMEI